MTISVSNDVVLAFVLLFCRAGSVMVALPQILGVAIPVRISLLLGALLAGALMPLASVVVPTGGLVVLAILVLRELAIGVVLSFAAAVVVGAVMIAADVIGNGMELTSGGLLRGTLNVPNILADGLGTLAGLLFFVGGFHRALLRALGRSLAVAPLGLIAFPDPHTLIRLGGRMFLLALALGLPLIVPLFVLAIAQGVIARLAPQVNILVAAPAAMILAGLILFALDAAGFAGALMRVWAAVMDEALGWLHG